MGQVTGLRVLKGVVELSVDGGVLAYIKKASFDAMPCQTGDFLDEEEYLNKMAALQSNACYEEALNLLDFAQKSKSALQKQLTRKGYVEEAAQAAVERLAQVGLLNDAAYAQRIVEQNKKKPVGRYAMKQKLRAKGFSEEDAENAAEELDDAQQLAQATQLAEKLCSKYQDEENPRKGRAKLSQALARRGFSWDIVSQAVEKVMSDDGDDW